MTQKIANGDPLGGHRIVQTKFRNVVPHGLGPVETPLVVQERHSGRGKRFGNRANQKLSRGGDRKIRLDIALTVSLRERYLAILHHGDGRTRYLPICHDVDGKTIELGNEFSDQDIALAS